MSLIRGGYAGFYGKEIIRPDDMGDRERSFYSDLIDSLTPTLDIRELVVEQRNGDYRTVVYKDWDNDFLRYEFMPNGFWVSVRMYGPLANYYYNSPIFDAQLNKRQLHWKSSVRAEDISSLADVMVASCRGFFGEFDSDVVNMPEKTSQENMQDSINSLLRINECLNDTLGDREYSFLHSRDLTVVGTFHYEASKSVTDGTVLHCRHDEVNEYDEHAVGVYTESGDMVGHLPAKGAAKETVYRAIMDGASPLAIVINDGTNGGTRIKRKKIHVALIVIDD